MNDMNEQRVIVLNDVSDVTKDVRSRILKNDLDVLQINYNCDENTRSPFYGLNDLTEIKFEIRLGNNVQSLNGFFYNCKALKSVPLFDTEKVTDMHDMFAYCESLKSVPLFDTEKVTDMHDMFAFCNALKSVPLFNTANVTDMGYMVYGCNKLESVPLFNTEKVINMSHMFCGCTNNLERGED